MATLTTIRPPQNAPLFIDFVELWSYRELFYIFVWRNIKVRYKQTFLGIAWVVFQPLVSMVVFTIFFGNLAKIPSGNLPYPLFVLCGLTYWTFFSGALSQASNSLIENSNIITKVYIPKIVLPLTAVITSLIDFFISLGLLLAALIYFKQTPSILALAIVPFGLIVTSISATGMGLFFSAINVKYRDVRYVLPFFIQIMVFLSPVIYGTNIISPTNKLIMALNPMTGVIESVRSVIGGSSAINLQLLLISTVSSVVIFLFGLSIFNKTEKYFADTI
ncbi:MAG: ABC-2 type transporter [Candidatus Levybacteria bacterium GW2011_GWC2_40_7]|nr:MAG: ABC-2 type transporter [Candidatus Levybacteria bacterium GW2011_GWC2_40_7]